MNNLKFQEIEGLFDSLKEMRKVRRQLMDGGVFEIHSLGLPNQKILDFVAQSGWHTEIPKTQDKFIKDLEDLIKTELKGLK